MNAVSVSKRYTTLIFLVIQVMASISVAGEGISIFGWVSVEAPRRPGYSRKLDNLGSPSDRNLGIISDFLKSRGAKTEMEKLEAVNSWVNEKVEFTWDSDDEWNDANETLARGKGDCEDHAITKMQLLRKIGFDEDQILFMIVYDLPLRQHHAILAVRIGGEYFVLDNVTDKVLSHNAFTNIFDPYYAARGKQAWIFGKLVTKDHP